MRRASVESDRLAVPGDMRLHAELGSDAARKGLSRGRIAVDDEDALGSAVRPPAGSPEVGEPSLQLVLVGMRREARDDAHATADVDLLPVDARSSPAVLDVPPERPLSLVADEQQRAVRVGE